MVRKRESSRAVLEEQMKPILWDVRVHVGRLCQDVERGRLIRLI